MDKTQSNLDDLTARKLQLEEQIKAYKDRLSVLAGPCSRMTVGRQLQEYEMELERVRSQLGEI